MNNYIHYTQKIKNQTPVQDEAVIFDIAGLPTFMLLEGLFWIRLETIAPLLGTIKEIYLLSGETRLFFNDPDAGTYVRLDDFISICPKDLQEALQQQMQEALQLAKGGA